MKELAAYKKFLLINKFLLVLPALIFSLGAFLYQLSAPATYNHTKLFELNYALDDFNQKMALTDQSVAIIRSREVQQALGIDRENQLVVYKNAPLSLIIIVRGKNRETVRGDLTKISNFVTQKYPGVFLGELQSVEKTSTLIFALLGFGTGAFLGFIASLIKTYLQRY
ncbi:MAG: hypothetical protein Q7S88_03170 [Candidatus Daviesbacteria bacterium]|nr:hypothetical protein [Candidatus Daviesbacteria bacterium]